MHSAYDGASGLPSAAGDWAAGHPAVGQLEGPGMPVARGTSHPALAMAGSATMASSKLNPGDVQVAVAGVDGVVAEGGEAEGDGDDKTYCFCGAVSYGEMIACDQFECEREWVRTYMILSSFRLIRYFWKFHLACIGLTVPPDGTWYCDSCKAKRNAKRGGRGGKRRAGGRQSGKGANGA